jgi:hypothetical protein
MLGQSMNNIEIARKTEARLVDGARRQGISVDARLERLINEREARAPAADASSSPQTTTPPITSASTVC